MLFVALAKDMLFAKLAKVEDGWLRHSGMTDNMQGIGFGCVTEPAQK
jgi:hypothetical protein